MGRAAKRPFYLLVEYVPLWPYSRERVLAWCGCIRMHRDSPILCTVTSMMHEISGQHLPVPQLGVTIVRPYYSRIRRRRPSFGHAFSGGWVLGEHIGLAERSGSEAQVPCETSRYRWRPPLLNEQLALVAGPHNAQHTLGARVAAGPRIFLTPR